MNNEMVERYGVSLFFSRSRRCSTLTGRELIFGFLLGFEFRDFFRSYRFESKECELEKCRAWERGAMVMVIGVRGNADKQERISMRLAQLEFDRARTPSLFLCSLCSHTDTHTHTHIHIHTWEGFCCFSFGLPLHSLTPRKIFSSLHTLHR